MTIAANIFRELTVRQARCCALPARFSHHPPVIHEVGTGIIPSLQIGKLELRSSTLSKAVFTDVYDLNRGARKILWVLASLMGCPY